MCHCVAVQLVIDIDDIRPWLNLERCATRELRLHTRSRAALRSNMLSRMTCTHIVPASAAQWHSVRYNSVHCPTAMLRQGMP